MNGMKAVVRSGVACPLIAAVFLSSGCAMFRIRVRDDDVEDLPAYDARYGAQDLRNLSREIADELSAGKFLDEGPGDPIMVIYGVQPRTTTFVDTQALTDRIRALLMQETDIRFVNESRRRELLDEQGYQAAHATQAARASIGKQLGAQYMLTGSLVEITKQTGRQVRVSRSRLVYYQLTMELTDLETGLIAWSTQKEFARRARVPLIGW